MSGRGSFSRQIICHRSQIMPREERHMLAGSNICAALTYTEFYDGSEAGYKTGRVSLPLLNSNEKLK